MSAGGGSEGWAGLPTPPPPPEVIRARLINHEGVTVTNIAVEPASWGGPPHYLETAAMPKITARKMPEDAYPDMLLPAVKRILYRLERVDGGGTFIYRQETPPWG